MRLAAASFGDGVATVPADALTRGCPKAWAHANGMTSPAMLEADFGFSSVTDVGVGDYTLALTHAMTTADFAAPGHAGVWNGSNSIRRTNGVGSTPTELRIWSGIRQGTRYDTDYIAVAIFGDLA